MSNEERIAKAEQYIEVKMVADDMMSKCPKAMTSYQVIALIGMLIGHLAIGFDLSVGELQLACDGAVAVYGNTVKGGREE